MRAATATEIDTLIYGPRYATFFTALKEQPRTWIRVEWDELPDQRPTRKSLALERLQAEAEDRGVYIQTRSTQDGIFILVIGDRAEQQ